MYFRYIYNEIYLNYIQMQKYLTHVLYTDTRLCNCILNALYFYKPGEVEKKYTGLLEKKWTSVIRLQKKVG